MVTVLRTIPPIAVQEQRVGEMSGGDWYDTSHSSTVREWERCQVVTVLRTIPGRDVHSSTGEESGRDVRW